MVYTTDTTNNYTLGTPIVSLTNFGKDEMAVYPNPFTANTTILINTATDHNITLKLYDALGHCVQTIAQDKYVAGTHSFVVHTSLPAGIYFAIANIDGYTISRKIIKQ